MTFTSLRQFESLKEQSFITTRRKFLQRMFVLSLLALVWARWTPGDVSAQVVKVKSKVFSATVATSRPNIVFILADDLGYGDFGVYGQRRIKTPNIDRLAAEGMRFTQHYAGSAVCAPSRSSLMTGQHTGHTPIRDNKHVPGVGPYPLPPGTFTAARMLNDAGYATALIGRWHLGEAASQSRPEQMGFDLSHGPLAEPGGQKGGFYRLHLYRNGNRVPLEGNRNGKRQQYDQDVITEATLTYIKERSKQPFFLYVPYSIPHAPLEVPDLGEYVQTDWPPKEKIFAAMVTRLDSYVGSIVAALDKQGFAENTLIIVTSDNGPHDSEGHDPNYFNSNSFLRGIKRDLYEGGIRVPMIARWRGVIKPGGVTTHVSAFWDFLPTAADLAGVAAPKNTDGISYLPTLLGKQQPQHKYLYWEFGERNTQAVRQGKWKAVHFTERGRLELYDLERDPGEQHDIAARHPEVVTEISRIMRNAHAESKGFPLLPEERRNTQSLKRSKVNS